MGPPRRVIGRGASLLGHNELHTKGRATQLSTEMEVRSNDIHWEALIMKSLSQLPNAVGEGEGEGEGVHFAGQEKGKNQVAVGPSSRAK